jgi:hypothetical protein
VEQRALSEVLEELRRSRAVLWGLAALPMRPMNHSVSQRPWKAKAILAIKHDIVTVAGEPKANKPKDCLKCLTGKLV